MIIKNPVFTTDMPDIDVLRVGDSYYMVSTTMFFMPGAPILKSKDLQNWEIVAYIFDKIADNDIYELKNGKNAYGVGQWATSLAYHNGRYYACFVCHDMKKTFIYHTDDIEKSNWERYEFDEVFHDMSFLFFEGKSYLVYGTGHISIVELEDDLSKVKEGGLRETLFETPKEGIGLRCEGCRAYVKDGYIYLLFIEWPIKGVGNGRRREICYRSRTLMGPYERKVVMDDDAGYENCGVAQGIIVDDENGNWYSVLFQDHGAVGRMPYVLPAKFEDGWPVIGKDGLVPLEFEVPFKEHKCAPLIVSDAFNYTENKIPMQFEWNHNPINDAWSFTENPGYLTLTTAQLANDFMTARNTLTERTQTPFTSFSIEGDFSEMKDGDYAGLAAFMGFYGLVGLKKEDGKYYLTVSKKDNDTKAQYEALKISVSDIAGFDTGKFFLKIEFDYSIGKDIAKFFYSADGVNYTELKETLQMLYTLDVFVGYRIAVFNYATKTLGGNAKFKDLTFKTEK